MTQKFPVSKNKRGKKQPLFPCAPKEAKANIPVCKNPKRKELEEIGRDIYLKYNDVCKENLGVPFSEILMLTPEIGFIRRSSPEEKKKEKRKVQRQLKRNVEQGWAETDVASHLSQRVPYSARKKQRVQQYFESKTSANERTTKNKEKIKGHVPASIDGNFEQLQQNIKNWPSGTPINWSEQARKYQIRKRGSEQSPPNAGQLLKEHLRKEGIDNDQYEPPAKSE